VTKVYVVNSYGNPIDSASRFGDIQELTYGTINPFAVDRLAWTIAPGLSQFQPEDYLMLTGPGSGYMVAGIMLFSKYEAITCLRYESQIRDYLNVTVTMPHLTEKHQEPTCEPGRIFVLNYSGHSINSALKKSDLPPEKKLVLLTTGNVDQFDPDGLIQTLLYGQNGKSGLIEYQPGDRLLISGPALLHICAAAAFVAMGKDMSLLLFNTKDREYIARDVSLQTVRDNMELAAAHAA
jgi:hypothetical protein